MDRDDNPQQFVGVIMMAYWFSRKRNCVQVILINIVLLLVLWAGYRYTPFTFVIPNSEMDGLIEQLASANKQPITTEVPLFDTFAFLANPGAWDPTAQAAVSKAYYLLRAKGKSAFPYLINHFWRQALLV